jgi:putative ABC transport system permease protein
MSIARRNLFQDKIRLVLSVLGVALAVMLILVLSGLLDGTFKQVTRYLESAPGSIVVAQSGVKNLLGATSILPPRTLDAVRGTEGVEKAVPIFSQFLILDLHGKKQPVYMVGYDGAFGGGPWRVAEGREPQDEGEAVIDSVLAGKHEIEVGDEVAVMGQHFRIVGLSSDTTSWMTSFLFIRKADAEMLFRTPGATSFLLVTPEAGTGANELRDRLNGGNEGSEHGERGALPGAHALLKSDVVTNDRNLFARFFSAPLQLMVVVAFLVGTMVVGLVIYTATVERQREYGVLKAIGARNGLLYRVVLLQALIASGGGGLAGVGLSAGAAWLIMAVRPQFLVSTELSSVGWALLSALGMALLAALVPARVMARLAPADVFRK